MDKTWGWASYRYNSRLYLGYDLRSSRLGYAMRLVFLPAV